MPEDGAVSDVDAVKPLNLVKMDDDDTLLLRLDWSLRRQLLDRERGSRRLVMLSSPLEFTDRALCLQPFPLRVLASESPSGRGPPDERLDNVDSTSSCVFRRGLNQKLLGLGADSSRFSTNIG